MNLKFLRKPDFRSQERVPKLSPRASRLGEIPNLDHAEFGNSSTLSRNPSIIKFAA